MEGRRKIHSMANYMENKKIGTASENMFNVITEFAKNAAGLSTVDMFIVETARTYSFLLGLKSLLLLECWGLMLLVSSKCIIQPLSEAFDNIIELWHMYEALKVMYKPSWSLM